jgi:hypothetical protein
MEVDPSIREEVVQAFIVHLKQVLAKGVNTPEAEKEETIIL